MTHLTSPLAILSVYRAPGFLLDRMSRTAGLVESMLLAIPWTQLSTLAALLAVGLVLGVGIGLTTMAVNRQA
ncbi:MAG: hypothetical protein KC912_19420 [Proteobacteria bacterium]|nr:hypothetical protein [Pseudomonadota bacterium]